MSKILVAVSSAGILKHYMEEPFLNWLEKEVEPIPGVEIIVYGNKPLGDLPFHHCEIGGNQWADDVIWATHEAALETARKYNFDSVVFQGLDLLTLVPGDYERLLEYSSSEEYDIVAPIQMGRKEPHYPVIREWKRTYETIWDGDGYPEDIEIVHSKQYDITAEDIEYFYSCKDHEGLLIPCGFPGTEMCLVNKQCFHIPIANPEYRMWYRTNDPRDYLCVHEFWMLNAARRGFQAWVDTTIETAHCDDSGMAAISLKNPVPNEHIFDIWR